MYIFDSSSEHSATPCIRSSPSVLSTRTHPSISSSTAPLASSSVTRFFRDAHAYWAEVQ